jgi:uncharacterized membrane protein YfcA
MMEIIGFSILGIAAGVLSGLFGIGGAVLVIPSLVLVFGFSERLAQGTTLLLMIPPIGIFAALEYYKAGQVNIKAAAIIALFFLAGGWLGAKLALKIDPTLLRKLFAAFLMAVSVRMFFGK